MNHKILKFAQEAGLISAEYNGFDRIELTQAEQKFAQLIINDCVQKCMEVAAHAEAIKNGEFATDSGKLLHEGMWGGAQSCARKIIFDLGVGENVNVS
jgi:hypothetical protein